MRTTLRWIDAVDEAARRGLERPAFQDPDTGEPIFPAEGDEDDQWWLTELSRRKSAERLAREADEDGPPESTDDSDKEAGIIF